MWHLPMFLKRLELLIKPSGFGYNAYNQVVVVKIPNQIINYLTEESDINFVDIEGNVLCYFSKRFSLGTNEVEYYVKLETIDDLNYTSLFVYYDIFVGGILFEDDFESGALSTSKWTNIYTAYAGVSTHTANSGVYSLYTTVVGRVESKVIDLDKYNTVFVSYWIRRGSAAFSEAPDSGEDIVVEYLDSSSSWKYFDIFYGNGTPGQIYNISRILPVDALHSGFKLRFRQTGGGSGWDYWHIDDVKVSIAGISGISSISSVFGDAYAVNYLSEIDLISIIGPDFSNHGSALHQPICNTYAAKTTGGTTYISCSISRSSFTLFFNCYLLVGSGYLVYFSSSNYVYVNADGSLVARINGSDYTVGSRLYFDVCSTFGITCDGNNTYIVINGLTKLVIKQVFSITEFRMGGNGVSGYSVECYFFDLFLLPTKLPLYLYYLHNTIYNSSEFFGESGYDNITVNGYLTNWPEVIFSNDQAVFRSNIDTPPGWNYYRQITVTNNGTASVYDYNVLVTLYTSDIGNPYNNMNTDGSDIYFTSVSGEVLQYCLYSWDNTGDSKIIVSVDGEIPIGDSTIYMYYGAGDAISCSTELCCYYYSDNFDTKNIDYWTFDPVYQEVPCILSGENVLKMWGNNSWHSFYGKYDIVSGMEVSIEFLRTGLSSWHIASVEYDSAYHRWCIQESGGNLQVQYRINAQAWEYPKTLISSAKVDIWYVALLRVDDINGFYIKVWEKDNPAVYGDYSYVMPTGLSWRFRSHQYQNVASYHDNYKVLCAEYPEEILTSVSGEVSLSGTLINIQENVYKEDINYSVSFNNGSSWYVSGLDPIDVFFKDFSSPQVLDTVLRVDYSIDYIDKYYILVINDFNMFDVSVDSDFTVGELDNYCLDTATEFTTALPTIYGVKASPVEFAYDTSFSGFKSLYWDRPVEISWGGAVGSGTISKEVEYCFDIIIYSWCDDTEVELWLGELLHLYHIDYGIYFTLSSGYCSYINTDIDFSMANWDYFPHNADIICSVIDYNCQDTEVTVGSGSLVRFISDIKVSDEEYTNFGSSVFCSMSGTPTNYSYDVQTVSGSLIRYNSDIYCSLLNDNNNFGAEIKLNTIVISNFNIESNVIESTNFCFSVDVYDTHYGVTESGIQVYMNTNVITGNEVINTIFSNIPNGHTVYWCYDVGSLSPMEYIEIIVKSTNTYGDLNIASYFLRYGKRYNYNLYHIIQHDYETLIPMLMVAENNVDIFPSFSTETMYVRVENYKRSSLSASIFGVGLDKSSLPAEVMALTNNFYNGGHYTVRVECKDLAGNIMEPLEFEFTIRQDGL